MKKSVFLTFEKLFVYIQGELQMLMTTMIKQVSYLIDFDQLNIMITCLIMYWFLLCCHMPSYRLPLITDGMLGNLHKMSAANLLIYKVGPSWTNLVCPANPTNSALIKTWGI